MYFVLDFLLVFCLFDVFFLNKFLLVEPVNVCASVVIAGSRGTSRECTSQFTGQHFLASMYRKWILTPFAKTYAPLFTLCFYIWFDTQLLDLIKKCVNEKKIVGFFWWYFSYRKQFKIVVLMYKNWLYWFFLVIYRGKPYFACAKQIFGFLFWFFCFWFFFGFLLDWGREIN